MENRREIEKITPDNIRLSYSKLEDFENCPRSFFLKYISKNREDREEVENAYAQYGTLCHDLIDQWAKKEIATDDLAKVYVEQYDAVVTKSFPARCRTASVEYYNGGLEYFEDFLEVIPNSEVLSSEQKHIIDLFGVKFSGIIDMVVRLEDGRIAIVDHKSSSVKHFYGKKRQKKYRQLYIYAEIYKRIYGTYPDVLIFNLFREKRILQEPFSIDALTDVMDWAQSAVDDIMHMMHYYLEEEFEWTAKPSFFFCENLCDVVEDCLIVDM